jgi:uncharacterized protein DUF6644
MSALTPYFSQIEASAIATAIGASTVATASLSGLHLIGLTLLVGSMLVSSTRVAGILFYDQPVAEVTRAARRGTLVGLALSVSTGMLLVAPRLVAAADNGVFRIKMLILLTATVFHFAVYQPAAQGQRSAVPPAVAAVVGWLLWFGVALAGCAFILLE